MEAKGPASPIPQPSCKNIPATRMHSTRMRTVRPLVDRMLESASRGGSGPGGCLLQGGLVPGGVSAPGGFGPGGMSAPGESGPGGGISQHALRQTPPVDRHTPVKILPWPNFVAAGKKLGAFGHQIDFIFVWTPYSLVSCSTTIYLHLKHF